MKSHQVRNRPSEEQTGMINASYVDGIFSNDSNDNASCCPDVLTLAPPASAVFAFRFTLASSIISSVNIAIACASVFVNCLLMWAIVRVPNSELKAKRFIINLSIANMMFPILIALDPYFISAIMYMKGSFVSPDICVLGVYATIGILTVYTQAASTLGLASDRIYAVARPLTYSTIGYTRPIRVLIFILPWFIAISIWFISMLVTWSTLSASEIPGVPIFCIHLLNAYLTSEGSKATDSVLCAVNVFSFVVYISIFVIVKYKERTIRNMSMTTARNTSLSLARTYFMINVTTLALYLPAPLFSILTESATGEALTEESANIASVLLIFYVGNTCLDPLILMSRIPSIRKRLPIKFIGRRVQHDREGKDRGLSSTVTKKTQLKTDSI